MVNLEFFCSGIFFLNFIITKFEHSHEWGDFSWIFSSQRSSSKVENESRTKYLIKESNDQQIKEIFTHHILGIQLEGQSSNTCIYFQFINSFNNCHRKINTKSVNNKVSQCQVKFRQSKWSRGVLFVWQLKIKTRCSWKATFKC